MEEFGNSMRRYGVAALEMGADDRRSVRRRGEETAAGGCGWGIRERERERERRALLRVERSSRRKRRRRI
jgi:hypothetical protein